MCVRLNSVEWHKASQALYSFGYVILLSTLLLALLHLCCRCCCRKPFSLATVVGSLIIAGCEYTSSHQALDHKMTSLQQQLSNGDQQIHLNFRQRSQAWHTDCMSTVSCHLSSLFRCIRWMAAAVNRVLMLHVFDLAPTYRHARLDWY